MLPTASENILGTASTASDLQGCSVTWGKNGCLASFRNIGGPSAETVVGLKSTTPIFSTSSTTPLPVGSRGGLEIRHEPEYHDRLGGRRRQSNPSGRAGVSRMVEIAGLPVNVAAKSIIRPFIPTTSSGADGMPVSTSLW